MTLIIDICNYLSPRRGTSTIFQHMFLLFQQSMYRQLLAGLEHRHQVMRLGAVFASALLRAISFLERKWVQLCNDIRTGQLDLTIIDPACRSSMIAILSSPNPHLAYEIESICSRPSWKGILCDLWPRAKVH